MPEYNEVKIARILNPTSIGLGEYVINPFMGCEFSCLYCYVRSNRVVSRKQKPWGEYVDIRVNAAELLEKEISAKKPKAVLLGSTTECFQPAEEKCRLSRRILEILNKHKVRYTILTRSPFILDYLELLKRGCCQGVYFTVNNFGPQFKQGLEPKSPAFELRAKAVQRLLDEGIPVVPYFSPVLPWVSEVKDVFAKFKNAPSLEFECLNFRLNNIKEIIQAIAAVEPELKIKYEAMCRNKKYYNRIWEEFRDYIDKQAKIAKKRYNIYVHNFGDYFKNTYTLPDQRSTYEK